MYSTLLELFWVIASLNIVLLAVLIVFFINARINVYRQIQELKLSLDIIECAINADSSAEASRKLGIDVGKFTEYCTRHGIDTPEIRKEKKGKIEQKRLETERKIIEEEARFRAEQERHDEERRKLHEEEAQRRRNRLKNFGFR